MCLGDYFPSLSTIIKKVSDHPFDIKLERSLSSNPKRNGEGGEEDGRLLAEEQAQQNPSQEPADVLLCGSVKLSKSCVQRHESFFPSQDRFILG